jgi:hypothetical protein
VNKSPILSISELSDCEYFIKITFDRDMVESCDCRRWKEQMKTRQTVYDKNFKTRLFAVISRAVCEIACIFHVDQSNELDSSVH